TRARSASESRIASVGPGSKSGRPSEAMVSAPTARSRSASGAATMRANLACVDARVASSYGTVASYARLLPRRSPVVPPTRSAGDAVVCSAIPTGRVGYPVEGGSIDVTVARTAPGLLRLRDAPPGLPDPVLAPPTIAESGDPFANARIAALVARLERGRPVRIADVVDRLNATYVDWLFTDRVVVDAILPLHTNCMADSANS